eukprot:TRINITY_DN1891_c0_g1_i1.p1 TRINITY_DN1891_c0_g1~~TRINITY_DN1891_c0_g1_i1.p1  ORF type:complete len:122 (+),score=25.50 TRINITY_DN1891_c0_g1_i1:61-426(+)
MEGDVYARELAAMLEEISCFEGFKWHREGRLGVVLTGDDPRLLLHFRVGEPGIQVDVENYKTLSHDSFDWKTTIHTMPPSTKETLFPDVHTALMTLSERYKEIFFGKLFSRLEGMEGVGSD